MKRLFQIIFILCILLSGSAHAEDVRLMPRLTKNEPMSPREKALLNEDAPRSRFGIYYGDNKIAFPGDDRVSITRPAGSGGVFSHRKDDEKDDIFSRKHERRFTTLGNEPDTNPRNAATLEQ